MIDRDQILKLRPLLDSPLWDNVLERVFEPLLEKTRLELETTHKDHIDFVRGKIQLLRDIIKLKDSAKLALTEKE